MKNFTNNFKQFTSRLSARWLIMALMLLVGTSSAWASTVYFINSLGWTDIKIYYWGNVSVDWGKSPSMTKENYQINGSDVYKYTFNTDPQNVIFRGKDVQTVDIAFSAGKQWTPNNQWDNGNAKGSWSTYTPPATVTGYELAGFGSEGWNSPIPMTASNGVYTCTKQLSIDDYIGDPNGFKILERYSDGSTKYYGNNSSMTRGECTGWTMDSNTSIANCGLYTDVAGNYTFSFTASTKELTVTFPTACTPPTNNKNVVIKSTSRAYVYAWTADANETKLLGTWPGTQMSNTKVGNYYSIEIPTETDVKIILHNNSGKQTSDIGPLTKGKEYTYQFTLGQTTYKELRSTCLEPGCDDPAKPTIKINGETGSVSTCGEDGTLTIDANHVAESYKLFTKSSSTYTEKGTISDKTIQVTTTGTYVVRAYNGECMTESDPITFTKDTKPTITASQSTPASQTICQGATATLSVNESMTSYLWSTGATTQSISVGEAGTYTVTAKNSNGCESDQLSFIVTVNALPATPVLNPNTDEVCSGTKFTLPGDYNWYEVSTGGTKLNSATISGGITSNKSYWAEAKNASGCVSSTRTEYTLTVNDKPAVPTLSADKTSLIGDEKAIFTVGNTVSGLTYTLYNGENAGESQTSTGSNLTFKAGGEGSYTVRVTNSCGTSISTPAIVITVCTPQTNEFRHANSSYTQLQDQPTYYPGDKAYFVSTINCCLTGTWSANLQKGEEVWYTGLKGSTPRFYMTLTRAGNFTITNMATNGCTQDKNVLVNLDFTVTALSEVTNVNGTASGANIALTWNHSATHSKVMVVRYPSSETETIPAGGQAYTEGNTLGGGTVVYVGTAESCTDKNLPAGASYKYYFYTVNNNYYSEGVVLNMSSCPTPAKPQLESTAVTTCNGNVTTFGSITITNIEDYDNTYTFKLGDRTANPDANGKIVISSAANTEYTVTVTNSCGNSNSADVDIAINNITPTISGATFTQPGKAIELTIPTGITAKWSVSPAADLSVTEGKSTMFSAETNGTYTITATNGTCSDTHVVTVADAFYIYFRNAKEGEKAYANFYDPNQNTEDVQGGEMFYAECDALPTNGNNSLPTHFVNYNKGGRKADIITTDCDGYTWYGFKASAEVVAGTKYFYVHATNDKNYNGHFTHTVPTKKTLTSDVYYTLGTTNHATTYYGWNIVLVSAPYAGPKVHSSGATALGTNKFAALYVTDCSGKEIIAYQWESCRTQADTYANYTASVSNSGTLYTGDAGKTNNIRPSVAGYYRCKVTYEDRSSLTSEPVQVTGAYSYTESSLPVFVVNTNGEGFPVNDCSGTPSKNADKMKEKVSVDVKIYKAGTMVYDRKARMNYRGSSSLNFLKKSYAFCPGKDNCVEDKGRQDYVKTEKMNMLNVGTAKDKDWVLYAAAPDPSLMRNRLVFDTFRDMTGKWSVNSCYVQLYVDGTYKGVYVLMDKITNNENRVNITHEDGFIVKFDKTDKVDRVGGYEGKLGDEKTFKTTRTGKDDIGTYDTSIDQRFEIEYPEKDDYPTGWSAKVNQIQGMFEAFENALAQGDFATVQKYIDYDSWADWFIISEYVKNVDTYRASNIFVYNGNKIEARPLWDQELSFNNQTNVAHKSNDATGLMATTASIYNNGAGDFPAPFWFTGGGANITGGLLSDPCFVQVVKEKWNKYSTGTGALTQDALNAKIDAYTTELGTAADISFNRGTMDCGSCQDGGCYNGGTGYNNSISKSTSIDAMDTWIEYRGNNLTTALNNLEGASFSIQIIPSEAKTTPWEPVEIAVSVTPAGYDYKLEYTDNDLGSVANTIIKEEGDKITYRIPRPSAWGTGDAEEGARADIEYGIKATLSVQEGTTVCGSQAAPSSTGKIILQDEDNDNCK